jgi:hypothetical protein
MWTNWEVFILVVICFFLFNITGIFIYSNHDCIQKGGLAMKGKDWKFTKVILDSDDIHASGKAFEEYKEATEKSVTPNPNAHLELAPKEQTLYCRHDSRQESEI